jgi:hypothetical protein
MSTPYQQPFPREEYPQQPSGSGCGMGLLIGCVVSLVVCVLLCVGGAWYVRSNFDIWLASGVRQALVMMINESELPAEEKTEVIAQVDRVVDAYKARTINQQQLERLMKELQDSPLFALMMFWGYDAKYVEPSGLDDEEKQQGRRTIERVLRGIYDNKLNEHQVRGAMPDSMLVREHHVEIDEDGRVKEPAMNQPPVSDEDVRKFLANLKKLADDAEIPDEPFQLDISDELKKTIDKALAEKE